MASQALPKEEWQIYCDRISKGLAGHRAHIEVAGLALGIKSRRNGSLCSASPMTRKTIC